MPVCGRITDYRVRRLVNGRLEAQIHPHQFAEAVPFQDRMHSAFPEAQVTRLERRDRISFELPDGRDRQDLEAYLRLLRLSVSILDAADESFAMGMHWYRDLDRRSDLGELVYQAKSYRRGSGNRRQANLLSERIVAWFESHPRYRRADAVAPIPPGNPDRDYDLPSLMARRVAHTLGLQLLQIGSAPRSPQKGRDEDLSRSAIAGQFHVPHDLVGLTVVLLDDLYDSGATITEGTRALRAAGARAVLALTATKTSSHCEGVYPYSSNWED